MDEGAGRKRTRRRRRRRRRTSGQQRRPEATGTGAATPIPTPTPTRRASPGRRKPRGTPAPDRAGISTSMAMRAREVSRPDG